MLVSWSDRLTAHPEAIGDAASLQLSRAGAGYIARLDSAYPIVVRLFPEAGGWAVTLVGASFTTNVETVARNIGALEDAVNAGRIALETARILEARDDYRYLRRANSPNRWYTDRTAREPAAWSGRLPDLTAGADPGEQQAETLGYLDATFPHLVNLAQHRPHFDPARGRTTDPNEHTIEVLATLETSELTASDAYLARLAVLYHDIGKGLDAYDPRHPLESARLAAPLLAHFSLTPEQQATILLHIQEHDLLGVFSRQRMTADEALRRLHVAERPTNMAMHSAIATADISAIRGLRWVVEEGRIARGRRALEAALIDAGR